MKVQWAGLRPPVVVPLLLAVVLAACTSERSVMDGPQAATAAPDGSPTSQDAAGMNEEMAIADGVVPPTADSILYLIYQKDGDGATSYEIANGSWATYWYGHSFEIDGTRYFTGFAHATRERHDGVGEQAAGPDDKVDLSHATLKLTDAGGEKPWTFLGAEPFIGKFGAYDQGNAVDEARQAQEFRTGDGRLLLAVPTWSLQSGERLDSFDMFVFNPADEVPVGQRHWTYLGNVFTGGDNSASCGEEDGSGPCARSVGTLSFIPREDGQPMPVLRVERSGSVVEGPGQLKELGPSDAIEYRYDADSGTYLAAEA